MANDVASLGWCAFARPKVPTEVLGTCTAEFARAGAGAGAGVEAELEVWVGATALGMDAFDAPKPAVSNMANTSPWLILSPTLMFKLLTTPA